MLASWWWLWLGFMIFFLLTPVSYGWAYRGWGPPLPRYMQRQRRDDGSAFTGRAPHHHLSWGIGGDLVWVALMVGAIWSLGALFTR